MGAEPGFCVLKGHRSGVGDPGIAGFRQKTLVPVWASLLEGPRGKPHLPSRRIRVQISKPPIQSTNSRKLVFVCLVCLRVPPFLLGFNGKPRGELKPFLGQPERRQAIFSGVIEM